MDIDSEYNDTIESSDESETSSSDNPENIKIKFKRFIKGLKEYDLTLDELNETGWHYIGGNHKQFLRHFKLLKLQYSIEYIIRKAKNYDSSQDTFCNNSNNTIVDGGEWRNCVCHEPIYNLCFIANATREEFFIIGNCCIKSFIKANTITCEECGNKHRNKIKNLCNDCKICQECEICGSEHKNLNHNMCNKCYNKKECKDCKLKFSKKEFNEETERCKVCDTKYCENCDKKKNPKYIKYKMCYSCKFENKDKKRKSKTDSESESEMEIEIETVSREEIPTVKKCIDCSKIIQPNFTRCYPCKIKNDKKDNDTESEEEIIKKCIDCSKIIKSNFIRCYNCNKK